MSIQSITDWLTFVPAGLIQKQRAYVQLPAFTVNQVWQGASQIVNQYNFTASNSFILANAPVRPANANFVLCIRYRIGQVVYRAKLWDDGRATGLNAVPLITPAFKIKPNFCLEVWNINDGLGVITNPVIVTMITSLRSLGSDFRSFSDYALAVGTQFTNFAAIYIPVDIPVANLIARWVADDITGVAAIWPDRVSGKQMVQQSGAGLVIAGVPTLINGRQYVEYIQGFSAGSQYTFTVAQSYPVTIYCIVALDTVWAGDGKYLLSAQDGSNAQIFGVECNGSSPNIGIITPNGVAVNNTLVVSTPPSFVLMRIRMTQAAAFMSINGGAEIHANLSSNQIKRLVLNANNISNYGNTDFAEVAMYNIDTTVNPYLDAGIQAVLNYKYGFSAVQPLGLPTFDTGNAWLDNTP